MLTLPMTLRIFFKFKRQLLRRGHDQGRRGHRDRVQGEEGPVEDAMHATKAAVEDGILPGGDRY
jgi:hypothetical protein